MTFSLETIRTLLLKENLLKEFVSAEGWHLTIDSKRNFLHFPMIPVPLIPKHFFL